jgi:hypothetical protein
LANIDRNVALAASSIPAGVADHVGIGINVLVDLRAEVLPSLAPTNEERLDGLDASQHLRRINGTPKIAELNIVVVQREEGVPVAFVEEHGARSDDLHVFPRHA